MYKHIIDRSNLDEVVGLRPNKDGGPPTKITRREDLADKGLPRADIVLINGTHSEKQYTLYVTMSGFCGDMWILDILTEDERREVLVFAERMRRNAEDFPPAKKLICGE